MKYPTPDDMPTTVAPSGRCYFTPILWEPNREAEEEYAAEWDFLRAKFAAARAGNFHELDDMLDVYIGFSDVAAYPAAEKLMGVAGTDRLLESISHYVTDNVLTPVSLCDLCYPLGLWGRLSAVEPILTVYDRHFPDQEAEGLPAYLTTMLEFGFGEAADYPREDTLETYLAYESGVKALYEQRLTELGGPHVYALYGETFSVRRLAERYLSLLGRSRYERMMQPYLRQRFEACTGIDCSEFYVDRDFQPLTAAARLEAWLDSDAPDQFLPGERYFFGHHIPRS